MEAQVHDVSGVGFDFEEATAGLELGDSLGEVGLEAEHLFEEVHD